MSAAKPTVEEVYAALLERVGAGIFEVGSKLPSCRVLADELGSNPSTVNRAIRRMARHGLVRSQPRVGTFLIDAGAEPELGREEVERAVRSAVIAARRAGLDTEATRELFESALAVGRRRAPVVAFVECNPRDLERMTALVENTTGISLSPMLLDDLDSGWEDEIDVVAAPVFHLADLVAVSHDLDRVVDLNFVPSAGVLRELSTLGDSTVIAVVAPTDRGVERMRALARQYHGGNIVAPDFGADEPFEGVDVAIHPAAMELDPADLLGVEKVIVIDWELDPRSASTFADRVAAVAGSAR